MLQAIADRLVFFASGGNEKSVGAFERTLQEVVTRA
jgi:hypothetical protein